MALAALEKPRHNPFRPDGWAGDVFDFLASLKLAVVLLVVLGVVCIAGTITESSYTARLAQRLVYRAGWFDLLLAGIFINVLFATLNRFPWRISQSGFLITHLGVLTLLVGSLIAHRFGVEGNLMLSEGQSGDRISLDRFHISFQEVGENARYKFETVEVEWGHPEKSEQHYPIKELGLNVIADNFYPHSEWVEEWEEGGPVENPAVHFAIDSTFAGRMAEGWLAPLFPGQNDVDLVAANVTSRLIGDAAALQEELQSSPSPREDSSKGWLEIQFGGGLEPQEIDVLQAMVTKVPIAGTEYSVFVTEQFDYAYVNSENRLADDPTKKPNPAILYEIYRGEEKIADRLFKFSLIPEFDSMHGKAEDLPFKIAYRRSLGGVRSGQAEFAILMGPGDDLHWKVTTGGGEVGSGSLEVGRPVPMTMMTAGMSLVVDRYLHTAQRRQNLVEMPIEKGDFRNKAAHLRVVDSDGNEKAFWQEAYSQQEIELGGKRFLVAYGPEQVPLGFSIQLKDFRLLTYPGSAGRPMSYESDVHVVARSGNGTMTRDVTIKMNEPMDHGGFRVFQSSYINEPRGDPQISVFSIAHNPGIWVIYIGSIVLCVGIALMFWAKPFFLNLELKRMMKAQKGAAA